MMQTFRERTKAESDNYMALNSVSATYILTNPQLEFKIISHLRSVKGIDTRKEIYFLNESDVLKIHQRMLEIFGGSHGLRDMNLLSSSVNSIKATFGGIFLYPDIFHMAAALAYSLIFNHCFVDGNKRTAMMSVRAFFFLNQFSLNQSVCDSERACLDLAQKNLTLEDFAQILESKTYKIERYV